MSTDTITCHACGATVPAEARFCTECGAALKERPEVSSLETLPPSSDIETLPPGGEVPDGVPAKRLGEDLQPGSVIADKYLIERQIGQGGMGSVYKATEKLTNRAVALKLIRKENVANSAHVQRLINEGTTTRDLAHPNIVRVYDIGLHDTQPYMAMEYIEGEPLHVWRSKKLANNQPVPLLVVTQIIKGILDGLAEAHRAGVIHRDLKPENILLVGEPHGKHANVKIVDFGIALAARTSTGTGSSASMGTQLYMAPEQIRNADLATPAADLYAVSKIFYELLVGVLPTGHWQPPSGARSDVPKAIDALIEQGISNAPGARPQTAEAYKTMLEAALVERKEGNVVMEKVFDNLDKNEWLNVDRNDPKTRKWVGIILIIFIVAFIGMLLDPNTWASTY